MSGHKTEAVGMRAGQWYYVVDDNGPYPEYTLRIADGRGGFRSIGTIVDQTEADAILCAIAHLRRPIEMLPARRRLTDAELNGLCLDRTTHVTGAAAREICELRELESIVCACVKNHESGMDILASADADQLIAWAKKFSATAACE